MNKTIIWDSEEQVPQGYNQVLLWRQFTSNGNPNIVSIPALVEHRAPELKARYLSWIYDLAQMRFQDRVLIDLFQIDPGFNYWWMTLFSEKNNFSKSPQIADAIRLMALSDWIKEKDITNIVFASANKMLAECLRKWCKAQGILFEWQITSLPPKNTSIAYQVYKALPAILRSVLWMLYYLSQNWRFRGLGLEGWSRSTGQITFISYLLKVNTKSVFQNQLSNQYWASLPNDLKQEGRETNWLHIYLKDSSTSSVDEGVEAIKQLNISAEKMQSHVVLQSFLSVSIVFKAVHTWIKFIRLGMKTKGLVMANIGRIDDLTLWPLFVKDWDESMFGPSALENAFNLVLFEKAFSNLPKQRVGVYLQENQAWEFACIQSWRAEKHGLLVGCPHSTVRFWDLRYFFDPRTYKVGASNAMPRPDFVALNSEFATATYLNGGYPSSELIQVEALRYLYLERFASKSISFNSFNQKDFHLLVLGDYLSVNTVTQLKILVKAVEILPFKVFITVKPHPACPIDSDEYPTLNMRVTSEPIEKLLTDGIVAYVSSVTSAAMDVYCSGVPVISVLDPNFLNMSPLRGFSEVAFVSSAEELVKTLTLYSAPIPLEVSTRNYFIIDAKLPRWRKLLLQDS